MPFDRRGFLGLAAAGTAVTAAFAQGVDGPEPQQAPVLAPAPVATGDAWEPVRRQFALTRDVVHLAALLIAAHPAPVRAAIETHRQGLDADPTRYLQDNSSRLRDASMDAAARYLGIERDRIALTESTTMGLGLVYHGLRLKPGQEILTTEQDYFVTWEATRLAAQRAGATVRRISLYEDIAEVTEDALVERVAAAVKPETRVVALTWVHSSTGLKLPIRRIADALAAINRKRDEADPVLLSVDGVHGFANQDVTMEQLGCDFLIAGCHKWLFGPRGTGIVAAGPRSFKDVLPTIPSFTDGAAWRAWQEGGEPPESIATGYGFMPGGFKAFEHQWALAEAFAFHEGIGKAKVAERTTELATRAKEGLAKMDHVRLMTPRSPALSAGIVSFDIEGLLPNVAVRRLRARKVIASVAPYARRHVRLTPSIYNTPEEVDVALAEIAALKGDGGESAKKE